MRFRISPKLVLNLIAFFLVSYAHAQHDFSTHYFKIHINNKGWITSMKNVTGKTQQREFSPADKPSPLLSLFDSGKQRYYQPTKSHF